MNAQLDDLAGAILRKSVESLGIGVHTEKRTTEVLVEDGKLAGILFADGERLDCDMLVIAAGIRPNVGLAQRAGLTVERAIVTDDHMRSVDDDDIYVVGECAQHRGQVYGLVAPLWEQAKVLADHLTGYRSRCGLPRLPGGHQAQGGRRRRRVDGHQGAPSIPTTSSSSTPSPSTASTRPSSSGTASWSAPRWSATSARCRS